MINKYKIIIIACGNSWMNYPQDLKELGFNENMKYGGGLGIGIVNGVPKYTRIIIKKLTVENGE